MDDKQKNNNKKKILVITTLSALILIVGVIGVSYSLWQRFFSGKRENTLSTGIKGGDSDSYYNYNGGSSSYGSKARYSSKYGSSARYSSGSSGSNSNSSSSGSSGSSSGGSSSTSGSGGSGSSGSEYVNFDYTESDENIISIKNAVPISDAKGKKLKGKNNIFDFSLSAKYNVKQTLYYEVYAVPVKTSLNPGHIKIYLTDQNDNPVGTFKSIVPKFTELTNYDGEDNAKEILTGTLGNNEVKKLRLRAWIDYDYNEPNESKEFSFKVNVRSYTE